MNPRQSARLSSRKRHTPDQIRLRELELKRKELALQIWQARKTRRAISPALATIIGGVIGLIGTAVLGLVQANLNYRLQKEKFAFDQQMERRQFESKVITAALQAGDTDTQLSYLDFAVRLKLVRDEDLVNGLKQYQGSRARDLPQPTRVATTANPLTTTTATVAGASTTPNNSGQAETPIVPTTIPLVPLPEHAVMYDQIVVQQRYVAQLQSVVQRISKNRARYEAVARLVGRVPWEVIAVLHHLEAAGRFDRHLHNGDPLTARTINVPAGRPRDGEPPFTWEESAVDRIRMARLTAIEDWDIPRTLYAIEQTNGFGYRRYGVNSPYVWAGSQFYSGGKFVADGRFSPSAISAQVGAAVLLKQLGYQGKKPEAA